VTENNTTSSFTAYGGRDPANARHVLVCVADTSRVVPLLDGGELVFGRHPACSVVIDHDGVSRRHARLTCRDAEVTVEDLGSRNGTLVNGTEIPGPRRLKAGDIVEIGPATVVVAAHTPTRTTRQVATMGELEERLDIEADRAVRYHRRLGLVMLRLDGSSEHVHAHVHLLVSQLRKMDVLAEYGPNELALLLPEAGPSAVAAVAGRVCQVAAGLVAVAGAATIPEDASHAGELVSVARERLRGARSTEPRRRVEPPHVLDADIVAVDPQMKQVFHLAARAASSSISVLVIGETGTGKEVVAEAIHRLGPRARGPLVKLNCASLPDNLIEATLFGHDKGAFTGAHATKRGFFEEASGGTLFLDEIGELPASSQVKLLRALESKTIVRVGGTKEIPVDVRLVCATNRDLELEVSRGRFRADLFFRIGAFVIPLPPLRERRIEIAPLAHRFAHELATDPSAPPTIAAETIEALRAYDWPGNVRELRNVIERALVLADGATIHPHHLPDHIYQTPTSQLAPTLGRALNVRQRVAEMERDAVITALEATHGNQTQAARKLGISRYALIRLMDKHDLKPSPR